MLALILNTAVSLGLSVDFLLLLHLSCSWFKSNKNKYGGPISVGAGAIKPGESENSIAYIGFDSIDQVLPPSKYTYNMKEETDIPGERGTSLCPALYNNNNNNNNIPAVCITAL